MAQPLRLNSNYVQIAREDCLCMLMAWLASSSRYFPPQPGGGISAQSSSSSLGVPHHPINHEDMSAQLHQSIRYTWKFRYPIMPLTSQHLITPDYTPHLTYSCELGSLVPARELILPSSLVHTSHHLQALLKEGAVCWHRASPSLEMLGLDLVGCDHRCLIAQPELAVSLQAVTGVIHGFSLCSSCGSWWLEVL